MRTLTLGEIRRIGIEVYSTLGNDFDIDSAEYEVVDSRQEVIASGEPRIEDKKITMLFNTLEFGLGRFYLNIKYDIMDETLKARIQVKVVE